MQCPEPPNVPNSSVSDCSASGTLVATCPPLPLPQFGIFYQLTFYELSWDVMEPVSYFTGLAVAIGVYTWYISTEEECTNENIFQRIVRRRKDAMYVSTGHDIIKYRTLRQQREQLDKLLGEQSAR